MVLALAIVMTAGTNAQYSGEKAIKSFGQGERPGYGHGIRPDSGPGHYIPNLTDEQKEQLNSLRVEHYKEMKPMKAEMAELKAREHTLMSQEVVDVKSVNKLIDEQTSLMNKIQKKNLNHRLAVREILSDEQLMMLDRMRTHEGKFRAREARVEP